VVYEREIDGVEYQFRASGYLLYDNLVLIDHPTDTLWSQLLGQGIKGAMKGTVLRTLPSTLTTWAIWKDSYPGTKLLSAEKIGYTEGVPDPYGGYFASGAAGFSTGLDLDQRIPPKELVLGISFSDQSKAYPLELIREQGLIDDQLGDVLIRIIWDERLDEANVFRRTSENELLADQPLPYRVSYWFAWANLFPKTDLYQVDDY
jgi:hypothetical protein